MRGKLHDRLKSLEAEVKRLGEKVASHPGSDDLQAVHDEVKAARADAADSAKATQAALGNVTTALQSAFAEAARLADPPPAAKKANGKTAATPTTAATKAATEENS